VVELARALAQHPAVYRVELLTRLIRDPAVDESYGVEAEALWRPPGEAEDGLGGAHLIRLPCGPTDTYLRCARRHARAAPGLRVRPAGGRGAWRGCRSRRPGLGAPRAARTSGPEPRGRADACRLALHSGASDHAAPEAV